MTQITLILISIILLIYNKYLNGKNNEIRFWKEVENFSCFPSTKTVVYSFQRGLRFLLRNFREFGGEEEDSI